MNSLTGTSLSLLQRVKQDDADSWRQLCKLYGPTVYCWARNADLQDSDAADIVQEVFQQVAKSIAQFRKEKPGDSFRAWLRVITRNKIHDYFRRIVDVTIDGDVDEFSQQTRPPISVGGEDPSRIRIRALELIKDDFAEQTWRAFWRVVVQGDSPADVAEDLSISVWSVYQAKSRVLKKLRSELSDLV